MDDNDLGSALKSKIWPPCPSVPWMKPLSCPLQLLVKNLQFEDGKMIAAAQYFSSGSSAAVELTEEENSFAEEMRVRTTASVRSEQRVPR